MNTDNNMALSAVLMLFAVIIGIIGFLALMRVDQYLLNSAVDECSKISFDNVKMADGRIVQYPVTDVVKECLRIKGYSTE